MSLMVTALENGPGYFTGLRFQSDELARIRTLIHSQWLSRIKTVAPQHAPQFEMIDVSNYHLHSHLLDHGNLWPKAQRILEPDAVAEIRTMSVMRELEKQFGHFQISDEENIGHEEIYWRLVRPDSPTDVGPIHADSWFWNLGHGDMPAGHRRVKVWAAIYCDPGQNGLRIVPESHKQDWPYHGVNRDGFVKPQIDIDEEKLNIAIFESQPGDAIVFHDRLLHGGAIGGQNTRVSIEFTMFVKDENYFRG